jgi:hypothetical protein
LKFPTTAFFFAMLFVPFDKNGFQLTNDGVFSMAGADLDVGDFELFEHGIQLVQRQFDA